jgi:hypothetical protein
VQFIQWYQRIILQLFVKGISEKRGIEKNLWEKKFIKDIIYSKSDIQINLYYSMNFEDSDFCFLGRQSEKIQGEIPEQFPPHTPNFSFPNMKIGSASRTRTYNPAVTVVPKLSQWAGLSHHPTGGGSRALLRLIGENPHPLVSARFPLHVILFAELRSGLPYPTLCRT